MIQGLAIACSICKFTFPYDYTRKYSQLLAQRKQRETLPPPPSLFTHTHTVPTQGHSLSVWQVYCHARRSEAAEIGNQRRVHQAMAKQQRHGKGGKVEQRREGKRVGVLAAIDAEKFTFLAHCDCAWDTVKCLHCSACFQGRGRVEHKARREREW